jgi:phosphoribosylglycinamide formyltransferase-1
MKRTVILTGSELRHTYLRKAMALSPRIDVTLSFCEGLEQSLAETIDKGATGAEMQTAHLQSRAQSEDDFFGAFVALTADQSHPHFIPKGAINDAPQVERIVEVAPDLLIAYGCSLIKSSLVNRFAGRFLNLHLGLSPYYRGSGTNFWPLVNGEPEFVGATFMYLDEGVDTGKVIHQIRARVFPGDSPHQIGNRLIADATRAYRALLENFEKLASMPTLPQPERVRYYRRRDFTPAATQQLYDQFRSGLVDRYLTERAGRVARVPIIENPAVAEADPA